MRDRRESAMWWDSPRYASFAAAATGVLALGLCAYQLKQPLMLRGITEYDDGVYLGIVLRFVHGAMPYRDFATPNPPGLTVLLSPIALVGSLTGTRTLMAAMRVITAIVAATNAVLAGRLLRVRGVVPALVAGGALAVFPIAPFADKTLMLEPYLVLFCLLGMTAMFDGEEVADGRRLTVAGFAFGFAIAVKLFATIPAVVAFACVARSRSRATRLIGGTAAGALLPTLPFLIAPSNLLRDSVIVQLVRPTLPASRSVAQRIVSMTGVGGIPMFHANTHVAYAFAAAFIVVVAVAFSFGIRATLDWFVIASTAITIAAFLSSRDFFAHYAYFSATFLALLLGISCGHLTGMLQSRAAARTETSRARSWVAASIIAIVVVAIGVVVQQVTRFERELSTVALDSGPTVAALIPKGACTVTDIASLTIAADRFTSDRPGCPTVVDPFWTWQVYDRDSVPASPGPYKDALVAAWRSWLGRADYAVFSVRFPPSIPWRRDLRAWFTAHYTVIYSAGPTVYRFTGAREYRTGR